jgi:hypothetical protein
VALKIPQGGHSVIAAVTAASLTLVGAAGLTVVLETPLTQALAAEPATQPIVMRMSDSAQAAQVEKSGTEPPAAKLARCACARWRRAAARADVRCDVDELVVSREWVVARLNLHDGTPHAAFHAVEVMHLIDGHIDEDWRLASNREWP